MSALALPKSLIFGVVALWLTLGFSVASQAQLTCDEVLQGTGYSQAVTVSQQKYGPVLYYHGNPAGVGPLKSRISVGTYNVENLFEHLTSTAPNAAALEISRRQGNAREIRAINPDFQILVEVENMQVLSKFNHDYLADQYEPLLIPGNDVRGINVAILVKRDLPIDFEWRSHKAVLNASGAPVFSRDLPVGLVFDRNANGVKSTKPKFAILATHFKSQRVEPGTVDNTADTRHAQALAAVEIVKQLLSEFGPDLPVILGGDFNNLVHGSPEFEPLFQFGFKDTLDLVPSPVSGADRVTQYFFPRYGQPKLGQLDALLLLSTKAQVVSAKVIPDIDPTGHVMPPPQSFEEREGRPSDHRPIGIEVVLPN